MRFKILIMPTLLMIFSNASNAVTCDMEKDQDGTLRSASAVIFSTPGLEVDSDGAPNAYRVDGKGLSPTCDGVIALENGKRITRGYKDWEAKCIAAWDLARKTGDYSKVDIFGFATDKTGRPIVQGKDDPLPGLAFISTTAVRIPGVPAGEQLRQIDATKIPYIVLPENIIKRFNVKPADIAAVYRPATGAIAYAVYGDSGNPGEGSIKLHYDLGHNPISRVKGVERAKRGIGDKVVFIIFHSNPTTRTLNAEAWNSEIKAAGKKQLDKFGGIDRLTACVNDKKP